MTKVTLNLKSESGAVRDKDKLLQDILRQFFDDQPDDFDGHEVCELIIEAAKHYGYYQMVVEMQKELKLSETYKVLLMQEVQNG